MAKVKQGMRLLAAGILEALDRYEALEADDAAKTAELAKK